MKAKEYANKFIDKSKEAPEETLEIIAEILTDFMNEAQELRQARNAQTDASLISVLKEQSTKWRAFANNVNNQMGIQMIKPDGFKQFMIFKIPELEGKL